MKLLDYTGKLNNHDEYLKILEKLKDKSKYIEIVVIFEKENNELVDTFKNDIIFSKKVFKWWGTESSAVNNLYRIKASNELFDYLTKFETFCKYLVADNKYYYDRQITTDFGEDDIAFFDDNDIPLLFTTTHESYIYIREDLKYK